MQFKEGTPVYTANNDKVGDIERFVLDPRERKIIGLVVSKGFLFKEERVISVKAVNTADEEKVTLNVDQSPDAFPEFEEQHYLPADREELQAMYNQSYVEPVYFYPPRGTFNWYGTAYPIPVHNIEDRNIPDGAIPLKEGADVISEDGEKIGNVERIFSDSETNRITHFSITQGFLFKDEKLMPADWVQSSEENEVHLAVGSKTLEKLGDF